MINNARKRKVTAPPFLKDFLAVGIVAGLTGNDGTQCGPGRKPRISVRFVWSTLFMKSRENLVRLKQFQVNEKRRQLTQLEMMVAEFDRMANELDQQILAEEKKAGITDVNHFAYPTFAKAARLRRDNLKNSQSDLMQQRSVAEKQRGSAVGRVLRG